MKKRSIVLIACLLLGTGSVKAQGPGPAPAVPTGSPIVLPAPTGACCQGATTCVPEPYTKTTVKWVYSTGCEPLCLCYSHCLLKKCDCGHCEEPYTRRYLVKKAQKCDECAIRCVPSQEAPCMSGCCAAPTGMVIAPAPVMVPPPAAAPAARMPQGR